MELGNWLAEAIISENNIKNIIVIYPGRFQPMGRHHAAVYKKLASKFGKSNTYIATSDKVQLPKSPLNFKEKAQVMKQHGITNAVQVKNPYQSIEITSKYDPETTAVLFAVGKKDMQENPRFRVGKKKNGEPSYFQSYKGNEGNLQSYTKHGYLIVAPHVDIQIPGFGEMSGTTLRQVLATADEKVFEDVMGFYDEMIHRMLRTKFSAALGERIEEFIKTHDLKKMLSEASLIDGSKADVDDGPRYFYGNRRSYERGTRAVAERLGYHVVNYIINPNQEFTDNKTEYPDGPPDAVSFFPVGQAGSMNAGTNYTKNLRGNKAYRVWSEYVKKVAERVGYTFLNFLGAEEAVADSKSAPSTPEPLVQESFSKEWWSLLMEDITVPINIGDTVLGGRFKNKKVVVKTIGKNEKGDITINGRPLLKYRIPQQEPPLEEDISKYVNKLADKFKTFLQKMKQEGRETKQAFQLLLRGMQGEELSKQEKKEIGDQMKDVLKLAGFTAASILPGGIIYLLLTKVTALKKHMVPSAFINESFIKEAKANTHLTHLEELILTQGKAGYKQARAVLIELIKNLKGSSDAKVNTTVKWDGAPAIFTGINPDNGQFFVGTKSVFNKVPKINYTEEDIERNHGEAPGLAVKLKKALKVLPTLGIPNILQGDFMFDDSTLKQQSINGVPHYIFKPNTITYAVEVDSDLGRQLEKAEFGIVFHTAYDSLDSGAQFGASVANLKKSPLVWFDDAFFKDATGSVLLTSEEAKKVAALIKQADSIKVNYDKIPSALLNTHINNEIRRNEFLDNPKKSYDEFVEWVQSRIDKKVDKLKSERGKQKAIAAGQQQIADIEAAKKDILNAFTVTKLLAEAKLIFVNKYNNAVYNTKHFKDDGQGGLIATAPEGFVAIDRFGDGVKLVDRLEFSRANFAMDKGFTK
jgi:hypothetical protein